MPKKKTKRVNKKVVRKKKEREKETSENFRKFNPEQRKEIIAQWKAFPSLLRRMTPSEMQILGLDPTESEVFLLLKTRAELAEHLRVSVRQLYTDEHTDEVDKRIKELEKRWAGDRTPNVILGLYRGAVKEGDAARAKLWFQIFRDWKEKGVTEHTGTISLIELFKKAKEDESK